MKGPAEHLGLTQRRGSDLLNGKIDKFSIDLLITCLFRIGFRLKPQCEKYQLTIQVQAVSQWASQVGEDAMETTTLQFNPLWFASPGFETAPGEYAAEERQLISQIRSALPELAGWGDLPVGVAWASYSQDVWLLSWLEADQHSLDREGLIPFLAYIHYHETHVDTPEWDAATIESLIEYAKLHHLA